METLLLTGATGFLGRHIVEALHSKYAVTTLGRRPVDGHSFVKADLAAGTTPDLGQESYHYVVHAAGKAHIVPKTEAERQAFHLLNEEGTRQLLAALDKLPLLPKAFTYISTVAVYGMEKGEELDESTEPSPQDPYGISKLRGEQLAQEWGKARGVKVTCLRLPLVMGAEAPGNLGAMRKGLLKGYYFNIGKGGARRSIVLASDVAAFLPVCWQHEGVYNLTDGYHPSYAEVSEAMATALGVKRVRHLPLPLAKLMALAGTVLTKATGKAMPFDRRRLEKMTATITFADNKARVQLGWTSHDVLPQMKALL